MCKSTMKDNEVRVRLFGIFEIENVHGKLTEVRYTSRGICWDMLKYLLANVERIVPQEELSERVHDESEKVTTEIVMRTRLSRTRDFLKPLQLDSNTDGLIVATKLKYGINPKYEIHIDTDRFLALLREIRKMPLEDPQALVLCNEALELYRGPFLQFVPNKWVKPYQETYKKEFLILAESALARTKLLNDYTALDMLIKRAPVIVPEAEEFHKAMIAYLEEKQMAIEKMHYIDVLKIESNAEWANELV